MFAFCDKILSNNILKPHRKLFKEFSFSCFESIDAVDEAVWDGALNNKNLFLSYSYLKVLDAQRNIDFRFKYVIVYKSKTPIGVVYFQINDFSATLFGDLVSTQLTELQGKRKNVFENYIKKNENETIMRLITCGNNFISGEHGFYISDFDSTQPLINKKKTTFKLVETVIEAVAKTEKLRGKISTILVKDFYEAGFGDKNCWYCNRFVHFNVEPNMVITLPEKINSLSEYTDLFSKKYRQRSKHILTASTSLVKKRLTLDEIHQYSECLYSLYSQVFNRAKFKLTHLPTDYFINVTKTQNDFFYIDAWFLNDKIVSFASGFYLETELEAHYIGFDYSINKEYELYQTILYSFIEEAITQKKLTINLGRTASEIKTTVGAKAHDLICYIKPQNTLSKLIMKPFMQFLQPSEWVPRNPFK